MQAVGQELHSLILELQLLGSLRDFALAGGTSLALRYGHRKSEDIDLFSSKCIGKVGLQAIQEELIVYFGNNVLFSQIINEENGDQFCFLRALVNKNGVNIKIEILQNFALMTPIETIGDIKMLSIKDVGLLKLMSASNRQAKKDIYDLDIITDSISLGELLTDLQLKREKYNQEKHQSLFDLDDELSPTDNLNLLLAFDNKDYAVYSLRPSHSHDRIDIVPPSKDWRVARTSWIRKVRNLIRQSGISMERTGGNR